MKPATLVQRRKPDIQLYYPTWWHGHGSKMQDIVLQMEERHLIISGSAAKVVIRPGCEVKADGEGWVVDWEVVQYAPYDEAVRGRRRFDNDELVAAFGLTDSTDENSQWMLDQFGGDSAMQGKYIRWGEFLNIPCPGSGHDGDPNISIEVSPEIRDAVRQLLV